MRLIHSRLIQGPLEAGNFKMLTFQKLRKLSIQSSQNRATILPPVEFLSSITSTQLSEIIIDIGDLPYRRRADRSHAAALNVIRSYDEALCQLSSQLKSSSQGKKLVLALKVRKLFSVPGDILPRFSEEGNLKMIWLKVGPRGLGRTERLLFGSRSTKEEVLGTASLLFAV